MTNKELSRTIQEELKSAGIPRKAYSIRVTDAGFSTAINIKVKDISIRLATFENIVNRHEHIRYDANNYEILSGCNTFVSVQYEYDAIKAASVPFMEQALKITKNPPAKYNGVTIMEKGEKRLVFMFDGPSSINNSLVVFNDERCLTELGRYAAFNEHVIANGMAIFNATGQFK